MRKSFIIACVSLLLGCTIYSCSNEAEEEETNLQIDDFKQRCIELAQKHGLEVILNDEYIRERLHWTDQQLEAEMKEAVNIIFENDTIDDKISGKKNSRKRLLNFLEPSIDYTPCHKWVNAPVSTTCKIGSFTFSIGGNVEWHQYGNTYGGNYYIIECRHECPNNKCLLPPGTVELDIREAIINPDCNAEISHSDAGDKVKLTIPILITAKSQSYELDLYKEPTTISGEFDFDNE